MKNTTIFAFVAIAIAAGIWYMLPGARPALAPQSPRIAQDLYPLYDQIAWGASAPESFVIGTTTYAGVSITSDTIGTTMDPGNIFTPFEQYYDQKLKGLGWQVANELAAGGHVGGQTGYRKGNSIILTRFKIDYTVVPKNAPSECPCNVTLSLFSQIIPKVATFACENNKSVTATFYIGDDRQVDLKLSDGRALSVPRALSGSGARYATPDESFVFWNKGDTAFITEGSATTYSGCVLSEP
ncbi:MAG: MliC family protein [Candidatus Pacebacteria bacterium]|nr:MliC family protein [Candidatus Paceibacterota bacterium]